MPKRPWTLATTLLLATLLVAGCPRQTAQPEAHGEEHAHEAEHKDEHGHEEGHDEHGQEGNVVHMAPEAQKRAGVKVTPVAMHSVPMVLTTTGTFEANADREAHLTPHVAGRVVRVYRTVGNYVRTGEPLALIESAELGQAQSDFLQAQARWELALSTRDRLKRLFTSDLTAKKEVQAAENELRLREIELEHARNRLKLLGYGPDRQAALARTRKLDPTVALRSPLTGRVVTKHLTLGERVHPDDDTPVYTVTDMGSLWLNANLYERDLARVHEGQPATLTTPAYPGRTFTGRVSLISTTLERDTRTAQARITVANPEGRLKPQMFANIQIDVGAKQAVAIPRSALVQDKQETYVFVQEGPEAFEKRPVKVGPEAAGLYPVESGLVPGESIAVEGGFILKSELMKSSFGEHHH